MSSRVDAGGAPSVRRAIDWGRLAPLRLRAREIAEGLYAGLHRSALRGAGVEFGGYREYVAGDDLRWLDRRSLLRHERLIVRQFETETDRALCIVIDASASMSYRGPDAPASKLAFASVVAAALAHVALSQGDPVSLTFVGGARSASLQRGSGRMQLEQVLHSLETVEAAGDASVDPDMLGRAIPIAVRGAKRGAMFVVLGDLLDWPDREIERVAAMGSGGRILAVVQTLDPAEASFPFDGPVRLRALEGGDVVETDGASARAAYLEALDRLTQRWRERVVARGGRFSRVTTADSPVTVLRDVIASIR